MYGWFFLFMVFNKVKFYLGIVFITLSLIIGKVTIVTFLYYGQFGKYLSVAAYLISWPMLFVGVYCCGKEYINKVNDRVYRNTLNKVKDRLGRNFERVGSNLQRVGKNLSKVKNFKIRKKK
jgi:hypothetical protein